MMLARKVVQKGRSLSAAAKPAVAAAAGGDEAAVKARLATIREAIANPKPSGPPPAAPGAPKVYRRDGPASADIDESKVEQLLAERAQAKRSKD